MSLIGGGADTANSSLTTITADSSAHSKGSWTELISSTSQDIEWLEIQMESDSDTATFLLDIGVGDPTPSVVVPDIEIYFRDSGSPSAQSLIIPITIASGSKVSARCQATTASRTLKAAIIGGGSSSFGTSSNVDSIGSDSSTSKGTVIDAGSTANTWGGWAELTASSSNAYNWVAVGINYNTNNAMQAGTFLVQIGTGALGVETVLIPEALQTTDAFEIGGQRYHDYQVNIPASTRIVARCQSTITDATDRKLDITLLGSELTAPSGGGSGVAKLIGPGGLIAA